ncbi:MAG: histidinol dehydrogenase [Bacillota bacterium]
MKMIKKPVPQVQRQVDLIKERVAQILATVREEGDKALSKYSREFDNCERENPLVTEEEIKNAYRQINATTLDDLKFAAKNIEEFARFQKEILYDIDKEILPGVFLGHRVIPVEACAGYVPGGRYPLPSSALMSIIPAKVAGVKRIVACSPSGKDQESIHPATLVAMDLSGAQEIYCMGGAQAIAALAYGTERIKAVNLIVGPGNQYVTEAKRQVSGEVGIDFLAGPSEVLVIADSSADPGTIAVDLLAQAEHDPVARGILLCTDEKLARAVQEEIEKYLKILPTSKIAREAWINNGKIVLFESLEEAIDYANQVAPEHLEIHVAEPDRIKSFLVNYGSLFVGEETAEVFGDYSSGTNHILPTMKTASFTGGVWVGTFLKVVTHQRITEEGLRLIGPVASRLAELEGLHAHKLAADVRLEKVKN